jgi:hypothetical protein
VEVAGTTVKLTVWLFTPDMLAMILVVPVATALAEPYEVIVAILVLKLVQVTSLPIS